MIWKNPTVSTVGFLTRGLERREVEKRIYVKGSGSRLPPPFMIIA